MAVSWWKRLLKGPPRPATGRRPRRASVLLRVEELETREVPTVGINLVNGQLQVTGNGDADVITVDHSGDTTSSTGCRSRMRRSRATSASTPGPATTW
jgi:hypothetical protein